MGVKVLLFDLDGTLVRAGGAGRHALNAAVCRLYRVRRDPGDWKLAGKTDMRNFSEAIRLVTGRKPRPREIERVHREYLRLLPYYVRRAVRLKRYRLCPGIKPLLRRLSREEGLLLGLGTGNLRRGARLKLAPSGLAPYFRFGGYGCDSYHRHLLLKRAVSRARALSGGGRIAPGDVYVIGDTPLDVSAGRRAGYRTIAVGTGFSPWRELVRSRPDHIAKDFRSVRQWLNWLRIPSRGRGRPRLSKRP